MKTVLAALLGVLLHGTAVASGNRDQLIDQLLTDSGMKASLQRLPAQIGAGFMQSMATPAWSRAEITQRQVPTSLYSTNARAISRRHVISVTA